MITINNLEEMEEFIWECNEQKKVCLLYFGASWCGPCKKLKERLYSDECKEEMPALVVGYLDVDEEEISPISSKYYVSSLPTLIFVKLVGNKILEYKRIIGYDWTQLLITYQSLTSEGQLVE
jgi:thiol-disulfide isomerase/thioredoxin